MPRRAAALAGAAALFAGLVTPAGARTTGANGANGTAGTLGAAGLLAGQAVPVGPTWRSVDDPTFRLDGPRATANAALAATKVKPWLMAGWWQRDAAASPRPVAWTTDDWSGVESPAWKRTFMPLPKGTSAGVANAVAPNVGVTVAFGAVWKGTDADAAVWISTNRRSWRTYGKRLVREGQQWLVSAAPTKGGAVAVGIETLGSSRRPLVLRVERGGPKFVALPPVKDFVSLNAVTSNGGDGLVIVGVTGKPGATRPTSWLSGDGGKTWSQGGSFPTQAAADISTVSYDPQSAAFVAFGQEQSADGDQLVSWWSADGDRWRVQRFNLVEEQTGLDVSPVGMRVVDVANGVAASVYDSQRGRPIALFMTSSSWLVTSVPPGSEALGAQSGPITYNSHGVLLGTTGSGRPTPAFFDLGADTWAEDGGTAATSDTFPPSRGARAARLVLPGSAGVLGLEFPVPIRTGSAAPSAADARAGSRPLTWVGPTTAPKLRIPLVTDGTVANAVADDGTTTLVFGSTPVKGASADSPRFAGTVWRLQKDGNLEKVPTAGLNGDGTEVLTSAIHVPGGWAASGTYGPDEAGTRAAGVWTSVDGKRWALESLDQAVDADSQALAICRLGKGSAVAVGTETDGNGANRPVAWSPGTDAAWPQVDLPTGGEPGFASKCTDGPDGVYAAGQVGYRPVLWKTADGTKWTRIALPGLAAGQSGVTAIASSSAGYVVVGNVDDGTGANDVVVWVVPAKGKPRRLPAVAAFSGWGDQYALDVRLTGKRAVIAGYSGDSARVWTTQDVFAEG